MMFSDIQKIVQIGQTHLVSDAEISQLIIDSRQVSRAQHGTLFFAIKGRNHDGHNHIDDLYALGVRNFVVEQSLNTDQYPKASFFITDNSINALQAIGSHHRERFEIPVIGITGSNGKTIVKEWLAHLLSPEMNVVKSPKSYNSQIGVPLSIWQMHKHHELGIFEAGISTSGEMEKLAQVIKPDIGIFTNVGSAHSEGFRSQIDKINEKLKLFINSDILIYCKDHIDLNQTIEQKGINTLSWSFETKADIEVKVENIDLNQSSLSIIYKNQSYQCQVGFTDKASLENIIHCLVTLLHLGIDWVKIQDRLSNLPSVKMRLELKPGNNGCQIIDDTYNNDLAGLEVALGFLSQQTSLNRTLILSDILQSGLNQNELYHRVSELITSYEIKRFVGVGMKLNAHRHLFPAESLMFETTEDFIKSLNTLDFSKEAILIKGARSFQFERITSKLIQRIHGTVLEINLNALTHNLNYYRGKLAQETKLMVMVKAMAYGTGINEIAHLLAHHKVDYLGVAYVDEGVILRQSGIHTPIMVMNTSPDGFENIVEHKLEPEIFSFELLEAFIQFLDGKSVNIHLKIDTGMRRLGFQSAGVDKLVNLLSDNPQIRIKSVFSHLAGSDKDIHNNFSKQQANLLNKVYNQISSGLNITPMKHILNSSGILRFPEYHFDMVRLGIGLYGIDGNLTHQDQLLPISSLKTTISQINHIKQGETIGYGRKGKASQDLTIATIAIGYADGFSRAFSNGVGEVIVNGRTAPVIGNVCMDMTMINITDVKSSVGDEVILFGEQMPITSLAKKLNTIPYEVLTNVSERVKRVYFQN